MDKGDQSDVRQKGKKELIIHDKKDYNGHSHPHMPIFAHLPPPQSNDQLQSESGHWTTEVLHQKTGVQVGSYQKKCLNALTPQWVFYQPQLNPPETYPADWPNLETLAKDPWSSRSPHNAQLDPVMEPT